jgi:hypothetical protein
MLMHFMLLCVEYRREFGDDWPVDSYKKSVILKNRTNLQELLDTDDDLIGAMRSRECLSKHQLRSIQNVTDLTARNGKLLDILTSSSARNLNRFVGCLQSTQGHLVPLLTGDTGKQVLYIKDLEVVI